MEKIEIKVSNCINFENKGNPRIGVIGRGNNMVSHFARRFQEEIRVLKETDYKYSRNNGINECNM